MRILLKIILARTYLYMGFVYPNIKETDRRNAEAWGEYLSTIDWTYFVTFSTRYTLTLNSARMAMERFSSRIHTPKYFFWVAEKFECKDGYHTHGLLKTFHTVPELHDMWQIVSGAKKNGTTAYIKAENYLKGLGADRYCAKKLLYQYKDYDLRY